MSRAIKFAFGALIFAAAVSPAASAETPRPPSSVDVAYGDLNMSASTSGDILLKRIQSAADKACGRISVHSPLTPRALALCRRDAVEHTVRKMGIAILTAAWSRVPATNLASR
jgi:UrcA family protein